MYLQSNPMFTPKLPKSIFCPSTLPYVADYECPLCEGIFYDPIMDANSHVFCRSCFQSYYSKYKKCPKGKESLDTTQLIPVVIIANIIEKININCPSNTCSWTGQVKDLQNHLDNDCLMVHIICPNKGCKLELLRGELVSHLKECKFREETCIHCGEQCIFSELSTHYISCPKIKIECPQKCGQKIENSLMQKHIEEECLNAEIQCAFENYGCTKCKGILRKEQNEKMNSLITNHFLLMLDLFNKQQERIKELENQLKLFTNKSNIEDIPQNKKNLVKNSSTILDNKININNKNNNTVFISNSIQPSFPQTFSSINNHVGNNNAHVSVPLVCDDNKAQLKQKNAFLSRKQNRNIDDDNQKLESFDIPNDSNLFFFTNNIVTYFNEKETKHHFHFFPKEIDINSEQDVFIITLKLLTETAWIAFGLCDKQQVFLNKNKFVPTNRNINGNHGSFLLSSNNYSWNCKETKENNCKVNNNIIQKNKNIIMIYNKRLLTLTFEIGEQKTTLTKVSPVVVRNTKLTPCVLFLHNGDSIEYINSNY